MPYFVFLEFTDPKVRDFLITLRQSLTGNVSHKPVHVTVRGPYETPPARETLEQLSEALQGYGVVIGGAGTFQTNTGFAVYLRVQSPMFTEIWWKPDFDIQEFGINPHITMVETSNQKVAVAVENFLRSERIEIFTLSFTLSVYTSKQLNLFESSIDPVLGKKRAPFGRWGVKSGIMQRATLLQKRLEEL